MNNIPTNVDLSTPITITKLMEIPYGDDKHSGVMRFAEGLYEGRRIVCDLWDRPKGGEDRPETDVRIGDRWIFNVENCNDNNKYLKNFVKGEFLPGHLRHKQALPSGKHPMEVGIERLEGDKTLGLCATLFVNKSSVLAECRDSKEWWAQIKSFKVTSYQFEYRSGKGSQMMMLDLEGVGSITLTHVFHPYRGYNHLNKLCRICGESDKVYALRAYLEDVGRKCVFGDAPQVEILFSEGHLLF